MFNVGGPYSTKMVFVVKGVSDGRICMLTVWTVFLLFLVVQGDDLDQGMCVIKFKFSALFSLIRLTCIYLFDFVIVFALHCSRARSDSF